MHHLVASLCNPQGQACQHPSVAGCKAGAHEASHERAQGCRFLGEEERLRLPGKGGKGA
jgi:hypothetical protein